MEIKTRLPSLFTFSQSSLQDYVDCPSRFQLRYIEHLAWPAIETDPILENERRQKEGQLFHRLIQQHLIGLPIEKLVRLAHSPNLQRWWKNFLESDLKKHSGMTGLFPESSLSTPIGDYRLYAKYDLITTQNKEKTIIYDWKTYRKRPQDEWMAARLQTRVYRTLLIQAGAHLNGGKTFEPEQIEMIYWYADYPSEPSCFPYNNALYKRDWDILNRIVKEIDAIDIFPMTEEEKECAYCLYRSYCERGVKAAESEEIEAEPSDLDINFEQIQEIEF